MNELLPINLKLFVFTVFSAKLLKGIYYENIEEHCMYIYSWQQKFLNFLFGKSNFKRF